MHGVVPHNVKNSIAGQPFTNGIYFTRKNRTVRIPRHKHIDHLVQQWQLLGRKFVNYAEFFLSAFLLRTHRQVMANILPKFRSSIIRDMLHKSTEFLTS